MTTEAVGPEGQPIDASEPAIEPDTDPEAPIEDVDPEAPLDQAPVPLPPDPDEEWQA